MKFTSHPYLRLSVALLATLATAPFSLAQADNPAQGPIVTTLRAQWQSVSDKVIAIAEIVPEDLYDWSPTPEVRDFREQFTHLAGEGYNFLRTLGSVPGVTPPTNAELEALTTKAEVMQALRDSYAWQGKVLESLTEEYATEIAPGRGGAPGTTPRWNSIVSLLIDNMDHYGNLVTYVRLNGMVPPSTAARGARGGGGRGGPGGGTGGGGRGGPAGQ